MKLVIVTTETEFVELKEPWNGLADKAMASWEWDQFVSERNKSLRRKIRKAEIRFASGEAVVRSTGDGYGFDAAFDTLVELHQKRFEFKGEPGVFSDRKFQCFLIKAVRPLFARGLAEIVVCEVDGRPIVAHLYLAAPGGLQMYQSGICPDSVRFEPGHLLFSHTIRREIERGSKSFDFLRGNEPYKKFWGAARVPLYTVRCIANHWPTTFKHQVIRGLRFGKSLLTGTHSSNNTSSGNITSPGNIAGDFSS